MILRHGGRLSWSGEGVDLEIDELDGDGTGSMNVRSTQQLSVNQTTSYFKTELLGHVNSILNLPQDFNCHSVNVVVRGDLNVLEKVTIGPQCMFSVEGDKLNLTMRKLVIQTGGHMTLMAKPEEVVVHGISLDIRGGAIVSVYKIVFTSFYVCTRFTTTTFEQQRGCLRISYKYFF
jgi:hypothetical protein